MDLLEIARKLIDGQFHHGDKFTSVEGFEFEFLTDLEFSVQPPGQDKTIWEPGELYSR